MMKSFLYIFILITSLTSVAQNDSVFIKRELKLKTYLDDLRNSKFSQDKEKNNLLFKEYLAETLKLDGAFDYPFSNLKTLGSIKSPDKVFRLFNWNVEQEDRSNKYYCYILKYDDKKRKWKTIELVDNSVVLPSRPDDILDDKNWYGALYYKIIPIEKSNKICYTILGWDGNIASNSKLVDVLTFTGNKVKFGAPIFKMNDGVHKRLFFEHSKKAFMSLNFDEARKRIVYDHLSPETPNLVGVYEYYVPDFSYDELYYKNNKWYVIEDVIGVNKGNDKNYTLKYLNQKNGEVISEKVKNDWVNPSDKNAPAGPNNHVASLPDDVKEKSLTADKEKKEPQIKKQYNKNEFSMNPYYYKRGKRRR